MPSTSRRESELHAICSAAVEVLAPLRALARLGQEGTLKTMTDSSSGAAMVSRVGRDRTRTTHHIFVHRFLVA